MSPFIAYGISTVLRDSKTVDIKASPETIISVVKRYLKDASLSEDITITDTKKYEGNWYLVTIKNKDTSLSKAILADFGTPRVIVGPDSYLPQQNISGIGVPYGLIDDLNVIGHDHDGEE